MNITFISPFYYPSFYGGSEITLKMQAEWMASNGFNVQVVAFDGKKDSEMVNNVSVRRYPVIANKYLPLPLIENKGLVLTLILPVLKAMQRFEEDTDLYHIYGVYPLMGAGLYKFLGGSKPVLATLNNYAGFCPVVTAYCSSCDKLRSRISCTFESSSSIEKPMALSYAIIYPLLSRLAKKIDRYIAVSNNVATLYARYGFTSDKIVMIPQHIDTDCKKFVERKSDNEKFNILYVGAVSQHKGVDVLIRAFKMVQDLNKEKHLTIVGTGQCMSYCKSLVKDLQIEHKVTFAGYVDNERIGEFYSVADVFVHPARWREPFGGVLIEALSYNLPCIISDSTSSEIIGNAGLVFKNEDPEDLAEKLRTVEDEDLRSRLRRNCSEVVKRYNTDLICGKIAELCHELVAKNTR